MSFRMNRALSVLLLASTLLVAQWLLAQHEVQIESHSNHTNCEWCLTHTPLAGALPAAGLLFAAEPVPSIAAIPIIAGFRSVFHPLYASRAPPFSPAV